MKRINGKQHPPPSEPEWEASAKGLLKAELARRGLTYQDLSQLLARIGVEDSPENLTNKVNRGKFSAVFFFQCMAAIDCRVLRISE